MLLIIIDIVSIALLGIAVGIIILTFRGKIKFLFGVIATSGTLLLSTIANIYHGNLSSGIDVISATIDEAFVILNETISSMPSQQVQQMFGNITSDTMSAIKSIYTVMFPAILILNILLISFMLFMIIKQIMALLKKDVSKFPKFSELKLRRSATIALLASYILPFLVSNSTFAAAITNISAIISGVAFVCGFSYVDHRLRVRLRNSWFRLILYIAVFFIISRGMPFIMFALMFVALTDSFLDFRGLHRQEVKRDGQ